MYDRRPNGSAKSCDEEHGSTSDHDDIASHPEQFSPIRYRRIVFMSPIIFSCMLVLTRIANHYLLTGTSAAKNGTVQLSESSTFQHNTFIDSRVNEIPFERLLDFAIIGHPKTGSTNLIYWLNRHPQIRMPPSELHIHRTNETAQLSEMMEVMASMGPYNPNIRRGYKSPNDIRRPTIMTMLRQRWPRAKLIIGVRHPVLWFESYYNFHTRQSHIKNTSQTLPSLEELIGTKLPAQVYYHKNLALLGKTNLTDPREQALLGDWTEGLLWDAGSNRSLWKLPMRMDHPVLLYEVTQQFHRADGVARRLANDVQRFLELHSRLPLPDTAEMSVWRKMLVRLGLRSNEDRRNYRYALDICESKYERLRQELLEVGAQAAQWILDYFVPRPGVTVSSPEYFRKMLMTWGMDPCARTP